MGHGLDVVKLVRRNAFASGCETFVILMNNSLQKSKTRVSQTLFKYFRKLKFFHKEGVARDTLVLGGAQALGYLLPLAAMPILIHRVGVQTYGLFVLVQMFGLLTQAVVDYGFPFTATRAVVNVKNDCVERNLILVNVTIAKIGLYLFCLILATFASLVYTGMDYAVVLKAYFPYSLLTLSSLLIPLWYFQGLGDISRAAIFTSIARLSSLLILFIFVRPTSTLFYIAWLYSIPGVMVAAFFWLTSLPERADWRLVRMHRVKSLLEEGRHVFATNVLSIGLTNAGPFIISTVSGSATVGLYAAAERVAKTISYIYGPLTQAIYPRVVAAFQVGHESGIDFLKRVLLLYIGSGIVLGAIAFFGADYIMAVLGATNGESANVLRWLAVWVLVSIVNNVVGLQLLTALDLSRYYMKCFLVSSLVYLASAFLLTRSLVIVGPAVALLIGEACLFALVAIKARKLMSRDYAEKN